MSTLLDGTAVEEVAAIAQHAAEPKDVERGSLLAFYVRGDSRVEVIDTDRDPRYTGVPERTTGRSTVWDAASLNAQWTKHSVEGISEVYADLEAFTVKAVFDAHGGGADSPGWREHTTTLEVRKTQQWKSWELYDGTLLDQETFAEHVENRLPDFVTPDGATMYELAQTFIASAGVEFESSQVLSSSQRRLTYHETIAAKAGQKGDIEIPATFTLGVRPFEGSPSYEVTARLRYRINGGNLRIGYKLERPEDVLQSAFSDVVAEVEAHVTPTPVLRGKL